MITQTKKNFLDRLFGRTNDKSRYSEQEEFNPSMPTFGGSLSPQPASTQAGSPTAQPTQPQPQSEAPSGAAGAGQGASRYKLFELFQPEPTRDTESEEMIRRRARINAFGSGLGAIAGLAGMASGGDAPALPDLQTPWNMEEMQRLDQNYRGQVENWVNRRFQVDQANTQLQNREIEQDINAENRMAEINQRGEQARILAEQRAQAALQQLQAKTQAEQIKEMMEMGIDPNSENAYGEYLQKNREKFNTDLNYTKARTNWNNRIASGSGRGAAEGSQLPYSLGILKAGRDAMIQELREQAKKLTAQNNPIQNEAQIKMITDRIKQLETYKPGVNQLMDMEIGEMGMNLLNPQENSPENQSNIDSFPYQPGQGFNFNSGEQAQQARPDVANRITTGLQKIASGQASDQDFETLLESIVEAGEAEDLNRAYELVLELLNQSNQ